MTANPDINGKPAPLYRVYVFSDSDCVNVVFKGALVGSPAYVPRMTGPLQYPTQRETLFFAPQGYLPDGLEGKTFMADSSTIQTTESDKPQIPPSTPPTAPDPSETARLHGLLLRLGLQLRRSHRLPTALLHCLGHGVSLLPGCLVHGRGCFLPWSGGLVIVVS